MASRQWWSIGLFELVVRQSLFVHGLLWIRFDPRWRRGATTGDTPRQLLGFVPVATCVPLFKRFLEFGATRKSHLAQWPTFDIKQITTARHHPPQYPLRFDWHTQTQCCWWSGRSMALYGLVHRTNLLKLGLGHSCYSPKMPLCGARVWLCGRWLQRQNAAFHFAIISPRWVVANYRSSFSTDCWRHGDLARASTYSHFHASGWFQALCQRHGVLAERVV